MKRFPYPCSKILVTTLSLCLSILVCCHGPEKKEEQKTTTATITNEYTNESVFEQAFRKVQANPKSVSALYHLADLYYRDNRYEEAVETFKKVVALDPTNGSAYFRMGTSLSRLNRPQEAIEALLKASEHLANPMVYNNLGIAYGKAGQLDEEIKALQKALSLRPKYAAAHYNLAIVYLKKSDRAAAMEQYEELQKIDLTAAKNLLKLINNQK